MLAAEGGVATPTPGGPNGAAERHALLGEQSRPFPARPFPGAGLLGLAVPGFGRHAVGRGEELPPAAVTCPSFRRGRLLLQRHGPSRPPRRPAAERPGPQPPAGPAAGPTSMAEGGGGGGSSSSSSSEDEAAAASALARLREATWEPARSRSPPAGIFKKHKFPSAEPSIREWISDQGQDGNELQTTPSFRAHVAKKLAAILDSSISPVEPPPWPGPSDVTVPEAEDDGFRLFSSSVPGDCGKPEGLPPGRRQLQRSSSSELDSDQEWQRCREAAVGAADILRQGGLPMPLQDGSQSCQAAVPPGKKTVTEAQITRVKEQEAVGMAQNGQAAAKTEGPSCFGVVAKKRKKKRKKIHTE